MAYPYTFANLSGNQPASDLDTMFGIVGQQGNIPCTATGTNVITLVSQTNCYTPAAYTDKQIVSWTAGATSTGPVTMSAFGLGVLNYYDATGTQSNAGSIQSGAKYVSQYCQELNSGAGGFITLNSSGTAAVNTPVPVMGSFKNLLITNTTATTAASQIAVSFDEAVLENSTGGTVKVGTGFSGSGGLSFTINANSSGANGLDTSSFGAGTYYVWVIYNPSTTTTAGLLSLSSTTPLLPSGYSYKARAGGCIAVTGPKFVNWMQKGSKVQNLVGTYNSNALTGLPAITPGSGAPHGSISAPTWVALSLTGIVPTTAKSIKIAVYCQAFAGNGIMVAPNNNYGAYTSTTATPPVVMASSGSLAFYINSNYEFVLESTNIYWASAVDSNYIFCVGWDDNVNA
jgi:hypothetical protein